MGRAATISVAVVLTAATLTGVVSTQVGAPAASASGPSRVLFGAYVDDMVARPRRLARFERLVRSRTQIASYFYGYGDVFPGPIEHRFADGGRRKLLISWHLDVDDYASWAAGEHDTYLDQIAAAAKEFPYEVYVRPWAEMNGDWHDFQPTRRGGKPHGGTYAEFKAAWRHVVTYLRERGADNLKWVFNPTADTYRQTTRVDRIWPGARYVDVLGLDGYNWGRDSAWGRWRSYPRIFGEQYQRLTALHRTAPVWICEFGSKEPLTADGAPVDPRHSKAVWLRRAFSYRGFPRIRALVYFHVRKERDWRLNSSRAALRAVRRALNRQLR